MSLRNVDLNLIVFLEIMLSEGSVTRTAKRLGLTQSAISQTLSRARDLFDDPLLVREGMGMTTTPRARALLPQLRDFCARAESLLAPAEFDPATVEHDFTIAANDVSELLILTPLVTAVARLAPKCRIFVRSVEGQVIDDSIDFAILGVAAPAGPFLSRELYQDRYVVLMRKDHPALSGNLTIADFAALPHALVSPRGTGIVGPIDQALERHALARRIALSMTRFTTLPQMLVTTDFVACVPSRFAEQPMVQALCAARPLPFESPPISMRLVWHKANGADPAHQWLLRLLEGVAAKAM